MDLSKPNTVPALLDLEDQGGSNEVSSGNTAVRPEHRYHDVFKENHQDVPFAGKQKPSFTLDVVTPDPQSDQTTSPFLGTWLREACVPESVKQNIGALCNKCVSLTADTDRSYCECRVVRENLDNFEMSSEEYAANLITSASNPLYRKWLLPEIPTLDHENASSPEEEHALVLEMSNCVALLAALDAFETGFVTNGMGHKGEGDGCQVNMATKFSNLQDSQKDCLDLAVSSLEITCDEPDSSVFPVYNRENVVVVTNCVLVGLWQLKRRWEDVGRILQRI